MDVEEKTAPADSGTPESAPKRAGAHDELFGRLVVAVLLFGLSVAFAFFAFLGYRIYEHRSDSGMSIAELPGNEMTDGSSAMVPAAEESEETAPSTQNEPTVDPKTVSITVLNGGSTKGAAGTLADFLKKAGYAKVTPDNAAGDYEGTTVFYQEGRESVANAILADVAKKYPKATISIADTKRSETKKSDIVVVIGK